jgi:hypothetical protein
MRVIPHNPAKKPKARPGVGQMAFCRLGITLRPAAGFIFVPYAVSHNISSTPTKLNPTTTCSSILADSFTGPQADSSACGLFVCRRAA